MMSNSIYTIERHKYGWLAFGSTKYQTAVPGVPFECLQDLVKLSGQSAIMDAVIGQKMGAALAVTNNKEDGELWRKELCVQSVCGNLGPLPCDLELSKTKHEVGPQVTAES